MYSLHERIAPLFQPAPKIRRIATPIKGLNVLFALAMTTPAAAQEVTMAADQQSPIEDVVVTGSRLARTGYETPTPVTVIGEQDILSSGQPNIADFVNELPSVSGSSAPSTANRSLSNGAAGISSVNLRSLGNARTLVLLDGRRSVGSLAQGTVDINTFPQGLVKNIEIVTGGASATYGSDAVSGVVNFILDKTYTGVKFNVEGGETSYGDDQNWQATLTAGMPLADGRGHLLFNAESAHRDGVYGMHREWADDGWYMVNNPAYQPGNGAPEYFVTNNAGQSVMTPGGIITNTALRGTYFGVGGSVNQFAYGATRDPWTIGGDWQLGQSNQRTSLEPESEREGAFTRMSWDLTDSTSIFGEASWNRNSAKQWGGVQSDKGTIIIMADNAFIPESVRQQIAEYNALPSADITQFNLGSSNADIPTRESDNERTVKRFVLGLEGTFMLGAEWDWDTYYQRGVTDAEERLYSAHTGRLRLAQDAVLHPDTGEIVCRSSIANPGNGCVPFNRMGIGVNSPEALAYFMGHPERTQKFEQDVAALNFSTEVNNPWLDPIGVAFGVEYRREEISGYVDSQYQEGWIVGNFLPTFGDYTVREAYLETLVSLPWNLEFNGAARGTDYSTSGFVTTWKAGLAWAPLADLRARVTLSRDIRAPNLEELYQAGRRRTNFVTDPFFNNISQRFTETTMGNVELQPEKADALTLGVVYQPSFVPGLALSADYYDIEIEDAISMVSAQDIVDRCYDGNQTFCAAFTRDPTSDSGNELLITNSPFNFVSERARGLDLEASYRFAFSDFGSSLPGNITLRSLATHYIEMSSNNGVDPPTDRAGQNTNGGPPDWQYRLSAAYTLDQLTVQLTGRGISSGTYDNTYIECTSGCPQSTALNRTINTNHIDGALYLDAFVAWTLQTDTMRNQIFFKVNNLTDKDPVVVGLGPGDSSNVEPGINRALYDYLGRTFRIGFRIDWGS
ncbi:TonB-dependent receptor [Steroidobacter sp. S1-65]|uniref:TonB-dependent receptor n=2 Tax=Steroidobacter gossypii TaxID=2805490 RepID=A0ABS1X015_9GAMM|nr:TonB-dependent receptor [Steroidobacter gossypii]